MADINLVFLSTMLIISLGYFLRKYDLVTLEHGKAVSRFLMHTTFPALMITSMAKVPLSPSLLLIPLLVILYSSIMLGIAWYWFKDYPNAIRGVITMACGGFNVGLFGFPMIEGLFGKEAMPFAIMYDMGNAIAIFGIVYGIGLYFKNRGSGIFSIGKVARKILTLPPVLGMLIGLIINIFDISLPTFVSEFLDILSKGNKPLVLLLMGIYLTFDLKKIYKIAILKVIILRYAVGFCLIGTLYYFMPNNSEVFKILSICMLLPIGLTLLPFTDEMEYDPDLAGSLVNFTLIISFGFMWSLMWLMGG